MFQVQIGSRQTVTNVSLQPWIAIKGSGSRQISLEKAHTKKANSHKEARKGRHFDNKLDISNQFHVKRWILDIFLLSHNNM